MAREFGLTMDDLRERYAAAVERFKLKEINESCFRQLLGSLGYSATEIEAEVDLIGKGY